MFVRTLFAECASAPPNRAVCVDGKNEAAESYTNSVENSGTILCLFPSIDSIFLFHGREHASKHNQEQPHDDNHLHVNCLRRRFLLYDIMDVLDEQHRTQCQRHEHEDVALEIYVSTNAGDGRALTQSRRTRITLSMEREECNQKGEDGHHEDNDNGAAE